MLKLICPSCGFKREVHDYLVEELGFADMMCYCGFNMETVQEVEVK